MKENTRKIIFSVIALFPKSLQLMSKLTRTLNICRKAACEPGLSHGARRARAAPATPQPEGALAHRVPSLSDHQRQPLLAPHPSRGSLCGHLGSSASGAHQDQHP